MAADISATMASLSATEGSNQPTNSTSVGANLDDNLRMLGALLAAFREATGWGGLYLTSVAGANTITASVAAQGSVTMAPTAYSTGMRFILIPAATNTGAATLNVNSLGAKNIFKNNLALTGNELQINVPVQVMYDGTQFQIIGSDRWVEVCKRADETISNSATLQDDAELLFAVSANTTYQWEVDLEVEFNAANAGFQAAHTGPAAATLVKTSYVFVNGSGSVLGGAISSFTAAMSPKIAAGASSNTKGRIKICGLLQNGANAGTVQLQWAQETAHASDATVYKGSTLRYRVIG